MFGRIKREYRAGKESGFKLCDIIWFFIRSRTWLPFWTYVNKGRYPWMNRWGSSPEERERYRKYKQSWKGRYNHIVCPICVIKNGLLKKFPNYYKCKPCNWFQYEQSTCNKCGKPIKKGPI